ncbi:MAG: hypothetical protein IJM09_04265, partial [Neisseriaceae bacterium]|nr:hypothetical protein [Neisseriaceae bacterium]
EEADFVVKDTDIFKQNDVKALQCNHVVNEVNLGFNLVYKRKMMRFVRVSYLSNASDYDVITHGFPFCPKTDELKNAAASSGWHLDSFTQLSGMPDEKWYYLDNIWIKWSNRQKSTTVENGITTMWVGKNEQYDWCRSATWLNSKRWIQEIGECYNIAVKNQQSIDFFNKKSECLNFNIKFDIDENDTFLQNTKIDLNDFCVVSGNNYYQNVLDEENLNEIEQAIIYALNCAKTKIYQSHLSECTLKTKINPLFDLDKTVFVDSEYLTGNVKIKSIKIDVNFEEHSAENTIVCQFYKGFAGQNSDIFLIERQEPQPNMPDSVPLVFGNVFIASNQSEWTEQNAFVIRQLHNLQDKHYKFASVQLQFGLPDIEKEHTDALNVDIDLEEDIVIPDNSITVSFKCLGKGV